MNYEDFARLLKQRVAGLSESQLKEIVKVTFSVIKDTVSKEGKLHFVDFGTFYKHVTPARKNIPDINNKGKFISAPSRDVLKFTTNCDLPSKKRLEEL